MPGACGLRPYAGPTIKRPFATLARWVGRSTNTADQYRSDLSSCRVALRMVECVLVPGDFLRPQGAFPQGFYPFQGGSPGVWGAPNKVNADGAIGIFGNAGRVWAPPLYPDPPKKRPCATLARQVGRATNNADQYRCFWTIRYFLPFLCNSIFLV